jgi:hypothetical protein
MCIPFCTGKVWSPLYVPSNITSLNQTPIVYVTVIRDKKNAINKFLKKCKVNAPELVNAHKLLLVVIGQGDGDTK